MAHKRTCMPALAALSLLIAISLAAPDPVSSLADDPHPPANPVRLIFVHHSTGGNWLADPNDDQPYGGLGRALMESNYYASATNYGWGPDGIGDRTNIPNWPEWFTGPNSAAIEAALYAEAGQNIGGFGAWPRLPAAPAGENQIILLKSCFPNSDLYGAPDDPPLPAPNDAFSVANAKAVYQKLLSHFATRQDKLYIVIAAPPLMGADTAPERAANARAFNNWLVEDWLDGYPHANVAVFDYYNVLTSNGSAGRVDDPGTPDEPHDGGWADGNHHRWHEGAIQHMQTVANNDSAYPSGDSHPATAGHQKATLEFIPLLNLFYQRWQAHQGAATPTPTATAPTLTATATSPGPASTPTATPTIPATLTPTATLPPGPQTITFQDGVSPLPGYAGASDTFLAEDFPGLNLGHAENLETFWGEAAERRRSLLRWDLAALPAGITIHSARVELYRFNGDAANAMPVALQRITRAWIEGAGADFYPPPGYVADGATWVQAGPGVNWTRPGGDLDAALVGQVTLPAGAGNGWIQLDATAAVRAWVEGGQPNYGLALRPLGGQYTYHYYHSREGLTAALRPRLIITYSTGGNATPSPTPRAWIYLPLIWKT